MAILEIRGLLKIYGDTVALRDFDLVYDRPSSIIVLIGPNGAGKTTLLRILAGQVRPTRGRVRIAGHDLARDADKIVRLVSFLPQGLRAPFYNLTPRDYIVSYLLVRGYSLGDARRRAREMLELFSLEEHSSTPVSKLSGGTVRRALIASVLADENAEVFLLDEPLPGLDPRSRMVFWSALREAVEEGKLALVSSHYTEDVPLVAEHVVVLSRGRKIAEGDPSGIIRRVIGDCSYKVIVRLSGDAGTKSIDDYLPSGSHSLGAVCLDTRLSRSTRIMYVKDPGYVVQAMKSGGVDVEVAPVGLGDIVLALGERE